MGHPSPAKYSPGRPHIALVSAASGREPWAVARCMQLDFLRLLSLHYPLYHHVCSDSTDTATTVDWHCLDIDDKKEPALAAAAASSCPAKKKPKRVPLRTQPPSPILQRGSGPGMAARGLLHGPPL